MSVYSLSLNTTYAVTADFPLSCSPPPYPLPLHPLLLSSTLPTTLPLHPQGACATYIGTCEVGPQEDGPLYEGRLNQGLWLVWKYEGRNTFNDLLDKKEADLASVAAALRMPAGSPAPAVAAKALTQVLTSLAALHKMGIVHRDVKPQNLIACESDGALRLIDLGAAASCLNPKHVVSYARGEGPCDPLFCSERFLIPEDAALPEGRNLAALWAQHTPDRFDLFSVGAGLARPLRSGSNAALLRSCCGAAAALLQRCYCIC